MRRFLIAGFLFLVLAMVILPTVMGRIVARPAVLDAATDKAAEAQVEVKGPDSLPILVYFPDTKQVRSMPLGEYLKGVVAAEMPPDFATEALKAQFVVARTYAVRRMRQFAGPGKGCPLNPAADICADVGTGQAYLSWEQAVAKMGRFSAAAFWKRLDQVQVATEGLVLRYRGELIDPLYHSVSGTYTEDSGDYFNQSLPYLKPVDDHWGVNAPGLVQTKEFGPEELGRLLAAGNAETVATVSASAKAGKAPVQIIARTATGRAKTVKVGGMTLPAREFREKLGLRSTDMTVKVQNGRILIETRGYGHGVGMSQYGADGMAKAGKEFRAILTHYYQGVQISPLFAS